MSSIIKIAQSVASYPFNGASYENQCDDLIELITCLKLSKTSQSQPTFNVIKNLYWTLVMKVGNENGFTKKEN